jgi:hypothetical protein
MANKDVWLLVAVSMMVSGSVGLGFILGKNSVYRKLRTRTKNWLD